MSGINTYKEQLQYNEGTECKKCFWRKPTFRPMPKFHRPMQPIPPTPKFWHTPPTSKFWFKPNFYGPIPPTLPTPKFYEPTRTMPLTPKFDPHHPRTHTPTLTTPPTLFRRLSTNHLFPAIGVGNSKLNSWYYFSQSKPIGWFGIFCIWIDIVF